MFKRFTDGITNILFRVSVGEHHHLVRIFGPGTADMLDRDGEMRLQVVLHSAGLAAELYGKFVNGMVYEYLAGQPLTPDNWHLHVEPIAREVARWHKAVVPLSPGEDPDVPGCVPMMRKWLAMLNTTKYASVWAKVE